MISREEAKAAGLKRYFTGESCKHGHVVECYVSGGGVVCVRNSVAKRKREKPERVKEQNRENAKRRRAADPDRYSEYDRKRRAANPEKFNEAKRIARASNPEKYREINRRWAEQNKEWSREYHHDYYVTNRESKFANTNANRNMQRTLKSALKTLFKLTGVEHVLDSATGHLIPKPQT